MLIGNPDKLAFLIERVPEWESDGFLNGLFYLFFNGKIYPETVRTTTLNMELGFLLDKSSPFVTPQNNKSLYMLETNALFEALFQITFPEGEDGVNDYRFLLPIQEIEDAGYRIFLVSSGQMVRFLIGKWSDVDKMVLLDALQMNISECICLKQKLQSYYDGIIR